MTEKPEAKPSGKVRVMLLRDGVWTETRKHVMGDVVEFDAADADRLIEAGLVKLAKDNKK